MAQPQTPEDVKYLVAILWADRGLLEVTLNLLSERWGMIDFQGADHPFDATDYYQPEMGEGLYRRLISFARLRSPEEVANDKLVCNGIEDRLVKGTGRRINLDVGYLDHNKLVLASAKGAGQKIYLRDGIYADLIARFGQGRYQPFPWTFPDFKTGRYDLELMAIRDLYLQQRKRTS